MLLSQCWLVLSLPCLPLRAWDLSGGRDSLEGTFLLFPLEPKHLPRPPCSTMPFPQLPIQKEEMVLKLTGPFLLGLMASGQVGSCRKLSESLQEPGAEEVRRVGGTFFPRVA